MNHLLTNRSAALLAALTVLAIGAFQQSPKTPRPAEEATDSKYTLSGPCTHQNLTVFLIHGQDRIKGKTFLILPEALAQKKVIVHETKQVNELAIENVSDKDEVFVQSGDILKGGQQDRIIAYDLIVPPKSGKMPLASFCVEAGRWSARGNENMNGFSNAGMAAPTLGLKTAARKKMDQAGVWNAVIETQHGLGRNLYTNVRAGRSPSSLELTLENKKVQESTAAFAKKLAPIVDGKNDAIGYVSVVNGQITSADVYASHALFAKLWPSLLNSSAVEAIAGADKDKKFTPIKPEQVSAFLAEADKGQATTKELTNRIKLVEREGKGGTLFESLDMGQAGEVPLRKNYLRK